MIAVPLGLGLVRLLPSHGNVLCPFRVLTHLECPGCGTTRAIQLLLTLDIHESIGYNPFGLVLVAGALVLWGYATATVCTGGRVSPPRWWLRYRIRLVLTVFALYILFGLGRLVYEWRQLSSPRFPAESHLWAPVCHGADITETIKKLSQNASGGLAPIFLYLAPVEFL